MEFTTTKEAEMFGYEFSCKVSDSIFGCATQVITVDAESIPEAVSLASQIDGVLEVGTLLGTIDRKPQIGRFPWSTHSFLAW